MEQDQIVFVEKGIGVPLVLTHGFPLDGRMWGGIDDELAAVCRVLIPDLPGFGRSTPAVPFTIDSLADTLFAHLQARDALPCIFAGFSMGGYAALSLAIRHSEALRGLVLVNTRAEADTVQGRAGREQMIELVRKSGATAVADQMVPKMLSPATLAQRPEVVSRAKAIMTSCSKEAIENALVAMRDRADRTNELAAIKVPTLIIVGDSDAITPPTMADAMKQQIPRSVLRVIPGAGHLSPMEQPAEVSSAIRQWLGTELP